VLEKDGTGHSGHYYIDRDGQIYRYVEDDRIAHHVTGHNTDSIGIELVNTGRYPNWFYSGHQSFEEPYTEAQIFELRKLIDHLRQSYPNISRIARHADLDERWIAAEDDSKKQVRRRLDPGPLFPWEEIQTWWNHWS
jgi:N-acetylmuramoyl-L-alanine amidase